ncbi:MAG: YicC family protein [Clostridia bacterium]|nr:YicC family protein [Clostridia bacterium]
MIRSMTGYGRATGTFDGMDITLEIKSVNHRYFEFSSRVPRNYGFLDEKLKSFFQGKIARGKVECYLQIDTAGQQETVVKLNRSLAQGYINAYNELSEAFGIENDIKVSDMARVGDIFSVSKESEDEEQICSDVLSVAEQALERFMDMRTAEGEKLRDDISSRLDFILEKVSFIEQRSPQTVREYNDKLLARMREVLADVHVDEQRLLTEAAIYADKIAVAEETVRLRSHIDQFRKFFDENGGAIGRKMDFLVQEINREINTIGSKAQDIEIARCVVDVKAEIEKIREQVQNIE